MSSFDVRIFAWFSDSPADLDLARAHCQPCPLRGFCLAGAIERREQYGSGAARSSRRARSSRGSGPAAAPAVRYFSRAPRPPANR